MRPTRRRFLAATSTTGLVAWAGCSGSESNSPGSSAPPSETRTRGRSASVATDRPPADDEATDRSGGSERWTLSTDGTVTRPVVADETVYVGSEDGSVYAVSTSDGTVSWEVQTGAPVEGPPASSAGTVYVANAEGVVYALDAADGSEQWQFDTRGEPDVQPTVADGTVYVGSDFSGVHALEAGDGEQRWQFEAPQYQIRSSPVVESGTVVFGRGDTVVALSTADGSQQWQTTTQGGQVGPTAGSDGTVYVPENSGRLAARAPADGTVAWDVELGGRLESALAVGDGALYVGAALALDATSGAVLWENPDADVRDQSTPAIGDGTVYTVGFNAIIGLSPQDGTVQWAFQNQGMGRRATAPAVAGDSVYFGSESTLYAVSV